MAVKNIIFTQRVSCCLSLLYVTMLANAMFYNTATTSESASNSLSFGPFSLSPEQVILKQILLTFSLVNLHCYSQTKFFMHS